MLIFKAALAGMLFTTCFSAVYHLLHLLVSRSRVRTRLRYIQESRLSRRLDSVLTKYGGVNHHVKDLLESVQSSMTSVFFISMTIFLCLFGIAGGYVIFRSAQGLFFSGLILGFIPYLVIRFRLIGRQMRSRMDFLPSVEMVYQYYTLSEHRNIRAVLEELVSRRILPYSLRPSFERMQMDLSMHREAREVMRIFAMSTGHRWAAYMCNILSVGLVEGVDISSNLKELIQDMRKAQRAAQNERNQLLEIRIANFTPVLFLVLFILINVKVNPHNALHYYIADPQGRNMLLHAVLLIFSSFVMGVYLSIRKL